MKKITFIITLLYTIITNGQNLISDGNFDTQTGGITSSTSPWAGFNSQVIVSDNITGSSCGNVNNGEGSIFQVFPVTEGKTYNVSFDYRWVSGSGNYVMTVRVKDDNAAGKPNLDLIDGTTTDGYALNTTPDIWYNVSFSFLVPSGVTSVRLLYYKGTGNRPLRMDNVNVSEATASIVDLARYQFKSFPNPVKNILNVSASKTIDRIEVYNLLGQQVLGQMLKDDRGQIGVSGLSNGVYLVKAFIEDAVGTYKFIKQ
ncbi:T9SS type A sorting domain-containing protein [Aestuariivivens sediminicola]|uniref:T9SS type A sorting domain-containing protein n=1 Tax=Aestuariivivens sediminicola TaxID=2913560 RepID=UPI001F568ED2|nr:T9SS type A sorting domain-containing protein [Aestuariivivens sediminicola]